VSGLFISVEIKIEISLGITDRNPDISKMWEGIVYRKWQHYARYKLVRKTSTHGLA